MKVRVSRGKLEGTVLAPPSKSYAHRLLIAGSLCKKGASIANVGRSEDVAVTLKAIESLGGVVEYMNGNAFVSGLRPDMGGEAQVFCGESGSTLRFLMPLSQVLKSSTEFEGNGRLPKRPVADLLKCLEEHGVSHYNDHIPFALKGKLEPGEYVIPGSISSQYITGLLFALPLLKEESTIRITGKMVSRDYIDMTLKVLRDFGIEVEETEDGYRIPGKQEYQAYSPIIVPGDYSSAAYYFGVNALGSEVEIAGLESDSLQGDRRVEEYLDIIKAGDKREISLKNNPDLLPILSVVAGASPGVTSFTECGFLRGKESDRIKTVVEMLNDLGVEAREMEDGIEVTGGSIKGGLVDSHGDHRIAMAAAIAGTVSEGEVIIERAGVVSKSYPGFYEVLKKLGGKVEKI